MPLVRRPQDVSVKDGTTDDLSNPSWDHRFEAEGPNFVADALKTGPGANVIDTANATCMIMPKPTSPDTPWKEVAGAWTYDESRTKAFTDFWRLKRHDTQEIIDEIVAYNTAEIKPSLISSYPATWAEFEKLTWPKVWPDSGHFDIKSKFANNQYIPSAKVSSGYYLGNNIVGTAGHCVTDLLDNPTNHIVVFNWKGLVDKKPGLIGCDVKRVILCDAPDGSSDSKEKDRNRANWSRRWDGALIEIAPPSSSIPTLAMSALPPRFGEQIYNCGTPNGTPLKVSPGAHVLRHNIDAAQAAPLFRGIEPYGTFSTTLDQFPGNSGGPVCSAATGFVEGHTVSTLSEGTFGDGMRTNATKWGDKYLSHSPNYNLCLSVNEVLKKIWPGDVNKRVYPIYMRAFENDVTCVMNDDIGPNDVRKSSGNDYLTFTRHNWDEQAVYSHNLSGRVDRNSLFLRSLQKLKDTSASTFVQAASITFKVQFQPGRKDLNLASDPTLQIEVLDTANATVWSPPPVTFVSVTTPNFTGYEAHFDMFNDKGLPPAVLNKDLGLANWNNIQISQSDKTASIPSQIGVSLQIKRRDFNFAVMSSAANPKKLAFPETEDKRAGDDTITWPAEVFEYANGGAFAPAASGSPGTNVYRAQLGFWQNPIQPAVDRKAPHLNLNLPDFMKHIDPKLAYKP